MTYLQDLVEDLNEIGSNPLTKNEAAIINVLFQMANVIKILEKKIEELENKT